MSLRQRATSAILAGELPDIPASTYERSVGSGHLCPLCRYRIQIGAESALIVHRSRTLHLHHGCFDAWRFALEALVKAGGGLVRPLAADDPSEA